MVEVFITDITDPNLEAQTLELLNAHYPSHTVNMDLEHAAANFPCGHSILRLEGPETDTERFLSLLRETGIRCDLLEDKRCHPSYR